MTLRSGSLPGIGTKYELDTDEGDTITIVYMDNGSVQLYTCPKGCCDIGGAAELNATEARRLGNILTGAIMEAEEEGVEVSFSGLENLRISMHSYTLGKSCANKTLRDLAIRKKTGATIIAVSRGTEDTVSPPPDFVFKNGDAVVVIGEREQIERFEQDILGK